MIVVRSYEFTFISASHATYSMLPYFDVRLNKVSVNLFVFGRILNKCGSTSHGVYLDPLSLTTLLVFKFYFTGSS